MQCPKCDEPVQLGCRYCPYCGLPLADDAEIEAPAAAPVNATIVDMPAPAFASAESRRRNLLIYGSGAAACLVLLLAVVSAARTVSRRGNSGQRATVRSTAPTPSSPLYGAAPAQGAPLPAIGGQSGPAVTQQPVPPPQPYGGSYPAAPPRQDRSLWNPNVAPHPALANAPLLPPAQPIGVQPMAPSGVAPAVPRGLVPAPPAPGGRPGIDADGMPPATTLYGAREPRAPGARPAPGPGPGGFATVPIFNPPAGNPNPPSPPPAPRPEPPADLPPGGIYIDVPGNR